jgi:hypothetical protein
VPLVFKVECGHCFDCDSSIDCAIADSQVTDCSVPTVNENGCAEFGAGVAAVVAKSVDD